MKSIRSKLGLATCSLLTQGATATEVIDNAWETDASAMYYTEQDRVDVTTLVGEARGVVSADDSATLKVVFDTMSGATPTGAVKKSNLTFTGASGGTGISTSSSTSAALSQFDDTRVAVSLDWKHEYNRTFDVTYNGAFSVENDYRSFSAAATANKETSDKSIKYTLGIAGTYDQVFRVGGNTTPVPLSPVTDGLFFGEGEKASTDVIAGITRVINRRTVVQLNMGLGISNGYLTDPYKIFSIIDANGIEHDQYYEKRPGSRSRFTLTGNLNHQLYPGNGTMHLQYRYYTDNWKINSHTLDYSHRFTFNNASYFEPRLRLYKQNHAYFFYESFYKDPANPTPTEQLLPEYLSADYRLDDMNSVTAGVTWGAQVGSGGKLRARLNYIQQTFENSEFDTNKAWVVQFSYYNRF
jgi:hypothetical protein